MSAGLMRSTALVLLALALAAPAAAQPRPARQGARALAGAEGRPARERLDRLVRERLQLTDAQATRLSTVTARYVRERDALVRREREVRTSLRAEVAASGQADQAGQERTAQLLDEMLRLQAQRLELVVREQRELAAFLSPVQRARFIALQEQMQRAVQQTRQRRAAEGGPATGRPVRPPVRP